MPNLTPEQLAAMREAAKNALTDPVHAGSLSVGARAQLALLDDRDALAERVRELEAELAEWHGAAEAAVSDAHLAARTAEARATAAEADLALLKDPIAVHANMLRGGIAKPSVNNILHLYPGELVKAETLATAEAERDAMRERWDAFVGDWPSGGRNQTETALLWLVHGCALDNIADFDMTLEGVTTGGVARGDWRVTCTALTPKPQEKPDGE